MSSSSLLRVVRQSGIYALGNVAIKLSGIVLAPLYLDEKYLTLQAFEHMALLVTTSNLFILVAGLGLGLGLLKFSADEAVEGAHEALPFTALGASALVAAAVAAAIWMLAPSLTNLILDEGANPGLMRLLAAYVALKIVGDIPLMLLRIRERAGLYTLARVVEIVVLMGAVYYFLGWRGMGLYGVMLAYVGSAGLSALILVGGTLVRMPWRFDRRLIVVLIGYGSPLVLASLAQFVLNQGDRYLLQWIGADGELGMYEWAARLSGVLNMAFVQPFQLAFTVIGLKSLGQGESDMHRRIFRHFVVGAGWGVLGLSLLAYDATRWIGGEPHYVEGTYLVLPLAIGVLIYGVYVIVNNVLLARWKPHYVGLNVTLATLFNIGLNLVLIPVLGALGAALATVAAFGLLAGVTAFLAGRQERIRYPWLQFGLVLLLVGGLYALGAGTTDWSPPARLGVRLALIAAYVPLVFVCRLYSPAELRQGWQILRGRGGF